MWACCLRLATLGLGHSHHGKSNVGCRRARRVSIRPFPEAPPIVLPTTGVKADVFLQFLTTLVMGGNGLCRPGPNLGFRVQGLCFESWKRRALTQEFVGGTPR